MDDPPLDVQTNIGHEWHEREVDLGDAPAEGGCGQVDDALAPERLGEAADLVHEPARGERRVVRERLPTHIDEGEHAFVIPPRLSPRSGLLAPRRAPPVP